MKGYVALTTVLIIIPLLLLTGVDSVYKSLTTVITSRMNYDYQILKTNKETCIEETIYRVKRSVDYTGEFTLAIDDWSCISTVTNVVGEPGIKEIFMELTDSNGTVINVNKELNTNINPFELSNL